MPAPTFTLRQAAAFGAAAIVALAVGPTAHAQTLVDDDSATVSYRPAFLRAVDKAYTHPDRGGAARGLMHNMEKALEARPEAPVIVLSNPKVAPDWPRFVAAVPSRYTPTENVYVCGQLNTEAKGFWSISPKGEVNTVDWQGERTSESLNKSPCAAFIFAQRDRLVRVAEVAKGGQPKAAQGAPPARVSLATATNSP